MIRKHNRNFSRREFLKLAAAAGLLAGCNANEQAAGVAPTDTPAAAPVPANTNTAVPPATTVPSVVTPTAAPTATPPITVADPGEIIKKYPDAASRVVHTHHAGVWNGDNLSPEAINQMLDASITSLTGLDDVAEAWAALFNPSENIAIKVNAFKNSTIWTHAPLVNAVATKLQDAGVPAEQIVIYDSLAVFEDAGYQLNQDGPGVRCIAESDFSGEWQVAGRNTRLSSVLQNCDALINMPVLKSHMLTGMTFALKNHFGSVSNPSGLHGSIEQAVAELNALDPIKERTRLIIGDVLEANLRFKNSWPYWESDWKGDSILMSFDPVAHDAVGVQILEQLQAENNVSVTDYLRGQTTATLNIGTELGLGTDQTDHMDIVDVELG